ncbi:MAG: glycolate oxidase subunit GlcE [Betaproteobacteria bacterium]|nr:glycolate oxidase subunit GlcE [Betaproteobacteria bacterium]
MQDVVDNLSRLIREAASQRRPLCIRGGGTKDFYGGPVHGYKLNTVDYRGILFYEPTELVVTARAGTPLAEIEASLREKGQMLAFEPPHFGYLPSPLSPLPDTGEGNIVPAAPKSGMATLGGCIAAGLSGPRRAYAGAARDFVLGIRMLDGKGSELRFGGQVMKNVAGYDVSRLMAGSLGTLGVLLEVSLKVLPVPVWEATLTLQTSEREAIALMNEWAGKPLPITATAFRNDDLGVRLSGARSAVEAAIRKLGGTLLDPAQGASFWTGIREQADPFFAGELPLWRLSVKPAAPSLDLPGKQLIEWGGALRWLKSGADAKTIRDAAARAGGHATLFRGGDKSAGVFHPLAPALMKIHRRLKQTFDPAGILNPGRMYDFLRS